MINYYVEQNGVIEAFDTDLKALKNAYYGFDVEIQETERPIVNFEFADTAEYAQKTRIEAIDGQIAAVETEYEAFLDSEVTYSNGKKYRVRYAEESYQPLISAETSLQLMKSSLSQNQAELIESSFPLKIWDSTKLEGNAVDMSLEELVKLALFLKNLQQTAWNSRKEQIAVLTAEKDELVQSLSGEESAV